MRLKLDVVIERDPAGRLHAFVRQPAEDGFLKRGADMLNDRHVRDVDTAIRECDLQFRRKYKLIEMPEVNYVLPGATQ